MRWLRLTNPLRTRFVESETRPSRYNAMRRGVAMCHWYMLQSRMDLTFAKKATESMIILDQRRVVQRKRAQRQVTESYQRVSSIH